MLTALRNPLRGTCLAASRHCRVTSSTVSFGGRSHRRFARGESGLDDLRLQRLDVDLSAGGQHDAGEARLRAAVALLYPDTLLRFT